MASKIKVGMLVHNPPYHGGIVQYCILLSNALSNNISQKIIGFRSLYPPFLYKGKLPKINDSGINFSIHPYNFVTWYNPFSWIRAYLLLSKSDIIHLQWVSPLLAPLQFVILFLNGLFTKKPVLLTCHNIEPHESTPIDKLFTRMVFSFVTDFVVHAEQNKKRLIEEYKIKPHHVHTVPHGTFGFFKQWNPGSKEKIRSLMGYTKHQEIILFFGYIREYKGLKYLLNALPAVLTKHPDARLLIAGELWQKWDDYKKIITDNNLSEYVKVIPNYIRDDEVSKYFTASDIVVLPYYNTEQTISGPLLVSLAFGKPTIVSPVGGIKEIISNGKNGIISKGGDVNELARNINGLISDKKLKAKLSKNALITNNTMLWGKVAKAYEKVYSKMAERCKQ